MVSRPHYSISWRDSVARAGRRGGIRRIGRGLLTGPGCAVCHPRLRVRTHALADPELVVGDDDRDVLERTRARRLEPQLNAAALELGLRRVGIELLVVHEHLGPARFGLEPPGPALRVRVGVVAPGLVA